MASERDQQLEMIERLSDALFGSERVRAIVDEIELAHCVCGAGVGGTPEKLPPCGIHARCERLRQAFRDSGPEN